MSKLQKFNFSWIVLVYQAQKTRKKYQQELKEDSEEEADDAGEVSKDAVDHIEEDDSHQGTENSERNRNLKRPDRVYEQFAHFV